MTGPLLILDEPVITDGHQFGSNYSWLGFATALLESLGGGTIWVPLQSGALSNVRNQFSIPNNVSITGTEYYESFKQYFLLSPSRRSRLHHGVRQAIDECTYVIVRAPSQMSGVISNYCLQRNKPLITIYAGDFLQAASPLQSNIFKKILLAPLAHWIDSAQRKLGKSSVGIISIGKSVIDRYRLDNIPYLVTSDPTISALDIESGRRKLFNLSNPLRIIRMASYLENKNYELLFKTISLLRSRGWTGSVDCYGLIKDQKYFNALQQNCPVGVTLHPPLKAGQEVIAEFLKADIQIICSRSEGIPRTILEGAATAVGLVTIPVGGIPSIVDDNVSALFAKGSTDEEHINSLADIILSLDSNRSSLAALIQNGLRLADSSTREAKIFEMANFIKTKVLL